MSQEDVTSPGEKTTAAPDGESNHKTTQQEENTAAEPRGFFLSLPACVGRTADLKAQRHTSRSGEEVFWEWVLYQSPRGSRPFITVINAAVRPCHCF